MIIFGKRCQSCSMPLAKDKKGGGSEVDGSKSTSYCSYCYQDGKFINPQLTAKDMQLKVEKFLCATGLPKFFSKLLSLKVYGLKRWRCRWS